MHRIRPCFIFAFWIFCQNPPHFVVKKTKKESLVFSLKLDPQPHTHTHTLSHTSHTHTHTHPHTFTHHTRPMPQWSTALVKIHIFSVFLRKNRMELCIAFVDNSIQKRNLWSDVMAVMNGITENVSIFPSMFTDRFVTFSILKIEHFSPKTILFWHPQFERTATVQGFAKTELCVGFLSFIRSQFAMISKKIGFLGADLWHFNYASLTGRHFFFLPLPEKSFLQFSCKSFNGSVYRWITLFLFIFVFFVENSRSLSSDIFASNVKEILKVFNTENSKIGYILSDAFRVFRSFFFLTFFSLFFSLFSRFLWIFWFSLSLSLFQSCLLPFFLPIVTKLHFFFRSWQEFITTEANSHFFPPRFLQRVHPPPLTLTHPVISDDNYDQYDQAQKPWPMRCSAVFGCNSVLFRPLKTTVCLEILCCLYSTCDQNHDINFGHKKSWSHYFPLSRAFGHNFSNYFLVQSIEGEWFLAKKKFFFLGFFPMWKFVFFAQKK